MSSHSASGRAARQARRTRLRSSDAPSRTAPSQNDDVIDLTGEPSSPIDGILTRQPSQAQASQHEHDDHSRATKSPGVRVNEHCQRHNQAHSQKPQNATLPDGADVDMADADDEVIDEDDLCPICQLLLYDPVSTTLCGHALCGFCMATWASVSLDAVSSANVPIVDVDDVDTGTTTRQTPETRCPMCRTLTSTSPDPSREAALWTKYPQAYAAREAEVRAEQLLSARALAATNSGAQVVTIAIGNRHVLVPPSPGGLQENQHEWTFFVRLSRAVHDNNNNNNNNNNNVIEEVHVHLHPTFRPSKVVLRPRAWRQGQQQRRGEAGGGDRGSEEEEEEFQVTRLGWGVFEVTADVVLKAGYEWVGGGDAVRDTPDGARNGVLGLEWMLDFDRFAGRGSMKRIRCRVRREGAGGGSRGARRTRRVLRSGGEFGDEDGDYEDHHQAGEEDEDEDLEMVRDMRETRRMIRQYERDGRYEP